MRCQGLCLEQQDQQDNDKDELLKLDYGEHLWMEKEIKSVANVTSSDVRNFLKTASEIPIKPDVKTYSFDEANKAIMDIKNRKIRGAKVLMI